MRRLIAFALVCTPAVLFAQKGEHVVSPGMTRAQVVAALGEPATLRTVSDFSYLFYPNSCGKACGMNDLVILHGDSVVDAIFRSPSRHYTGVSSSPTPVAPRTSARKSSAPSKPLAVEKDEAKAPPAPSRIAPPKQANDAKPTIPVSPTPMKPAPKPTPTEKPTK